MPDPIFDNLFRDTELLTWAPAEEVRRRGRQRSRRSAAGAVLVSAVAVAVVATGVVAVAGRPSVGPPAGTVTPSPSTTPTPTPTPTPARPSGSPSPPGSSSPDRDDPPTSPAIPSSATLRLSDVPAGYEATEVRAGDWTLAAAAAYCPPPWTAFELDTSAERYAGFLRPQDARILQQVHRYPGGDAARYMDQVRAGVEECGEHFSVLDSGFAGEESISLLFDVEGVRSHYLVVRRADLVSVVWHKGETDRATARTLGVRAADRLCAGTDTC